MSAPLNTLNAMNNMFFDTIEKVGRAAAHTLFPDNIEYYLCSLELIDGEGNTQGFMTFSVMPDNLIESETAITSITKTNSGLVTLFSDSFIPKQISIQGSFGRKIRFLLGNVEPQNNKSVKYFDMNAAWKGGAMAAGINTAGDGLFLGQPLIKTGYGLIKMLKKFVEMSRKLDQNGQPHLLIFTNYVLNTAYVVEVLQDSYSQSVQNNMIWFYSLEMKAVCPASAVKTANNQKNSLVSIVASGAIANGLQNVVMGAMKDINYILSSVSKGIIQSPESLLPPWKR